MRTKSTEAAEEEEEAEIKSFKESKAEEGK